MPKLRLEIEIRRDGHLHKQVVEVVFQIVVRSKTVGLVMRLAEAIRNPVGYARHDQVIAQRFFIAASAGEEQRRLIASKQRIELIQRGGEWARIGHEQPGFRHLRRNGSAIQRLQ